MSKTGTSLAFTLPLMGSLEKLTVFTPIAIVIVFSDLCCINATQTVYEYDALSLLEDGKSSHTTTRFCERKNVTPFMCHKRLPSNHGRVVFISPTTDQCPSSSRQRYTTRLTPALHPDDVSVLT